MRLGIDLVSDRELVANDKHRTLPRGYHWNSILGLLDNELSMYQGERIELGRLAAQVGIVSIMGFIVFILEGCMSSGNSYGVNSGDRQDKSIGLGNKFPDKQRYGSIITFSWRDIGSISLYLIITLAILVVLIAIRPSS